MVCLPVLACAALTCGALGCGSPRAARPEPALATAPASSDHTPALASPDGAAAGTSSVFGPSRTPPPISGGTLLVTRNGDDAIVSDAWRDLVWLVDLDAPMVLGRFNLREGDEPGRLVEDGEGRVHVVLRRGGAIVSLDPRAGSVVGRREVCPSPRGITYERARDLLHVACAGGELIELPAAGGEVSRRRVIASDLRDVMMGDDGALKVTRFRSAELLTVDPDRVRSQVRPPTAQLARPALGTFNPRAASALGPFAATVAWRTVPGPEGSQWMAHQEEFKGHLPETAPHYYGSSVTRTALTRWQDGAPVQTVQLGARPLLVDVAPGPGGYLALAFVGGGVSVMRPGVDATAEQPARDRVQIEVGTVVPSAFSQSVAVAWAGRRVIAQYRNPPAVAIYDLVRRRDGSFGETFVELGAAPPRNVGHDLFHEPTSRQVACATCHPEGLDDGHVWDLGLSGLRRTQPLGGGVLATAPFHWGGELDTFDSFLDAVFVGRMGGRELIGPERAELGAWIDGLPIAARGAVADDPMADGAVARGRRVFESPQVGCVTCHSGSRGSDGLSHDVGTGGSFQTPTLEGLAQRAPYMHDGCAQTLEQRLDECHTPEHGDLSALNAAALADLAAYMRSR